MGRMSGEDLHSEAPGEEPGRKDDLALMAKSTAALVCILFTTSLMNIVVFPQFDEVFTYARDISVTFNAVSFLVLGGIAAYRPAWLRVRIFNRIVFAFLLVGAVGLVPLLAADSAIGIILASSLLAIGRAWVSLVVAMAVSRLPLSRIGECVTLSFVLDYALRAAAWFMPIGVGTILFLVLPFVGWALTWSVARPVLESTEQGEAPAEFSITQPASFLPFNSQMFICFFLFSLSFGYSLRYGEIDGTPLADFFVIVPVAIVCIYVIAARKSVPADLLSQVAVLFAVAGFFTAVIKFDYSSGVAVTLLSCGSTLFDMVAWTTLLSVAARNERGAVAAFAWGRGVTGFGTLAGAALGVAANDLTGGAVMPVELISGALILIFVGYALIGMRGFSFSETIAGLTPVSEEVAETPEQDFEERCQAIAEDAGLTPRELEVFQMLARGRDTAYIQEQLVVSRNTVKAHVKHVYAKLDIHSHQELIDLVEDGDQGLARSRARAS